MSDIEILMDMNNCIQGENYDFESNVCLTLFMELQEVIAASN